MSVCSILQRKFYVPGRTLCRLRRRVCLSGVPDLIAEGVRADALEVYTRVGIRAEVFLRERSELIIRHPPIDAAQPLHILIHHIPELLFAYLRLYGGERFLQQSRVLPAQAVELLMAAYLPRARVSVPAGHPDAALCLRAPNAVQPEGVICRHVAFHADVALHQVYRHAGAPLHRRELLRVRRGDKLVPRAPVYLPYRPDAVRYHPRAGVLCYSSFFP